jgi:PPK2 family polyphosphate:nucleotide phosphotransferase
MGKGSKAKGSKAKPGKAKPGKAKPGKAKDESAAPKDPGVSTGANPGNVRELYRVGSGFDLAAIDPEVVAHGPEDRDVARAACLALEEEASELHEKLWAESRKGGNRSVLICLQGMDTSGKGGATKAIDRLLDPLGFSVTGFGAPNDEEKQHDYLWRHERALPEVGKVRLWDRSHYETVLIERVRGFVPEETWRGRYDEINAWEAGLNERGVTVIKFMLHISRDEQKQRLLERLGDPTKHWKYNPGDVDERALWDDYQAAYSDALTKCSTEGAPWYVVPANHKWHRDWILSNVLVETLRAMNLSYPPGDFDVAAEVARVEAS